MFRRDETDVRLFKCVQWWKRSTYSDRLTSKILLERAALDFYRSSGSLLLQGLELYDVFSLVPANEIGIHGGDPVKKLHVLILFLYFFFKKKFIF